MKDKILRKRILTSVLAFCIAAGSFAGCSKINNDSDTDIDVDMSQETFEDTSDPGSKTPVKDISEGASDLSLISSIKNTFASASLDEDYNRGCYNLPSDYVFEFPCSEKAAQYSYKAFAVYATQDYTDDFRTYNTNTVENGTIKVAPGGVVQLDDKSSRDVNNGTWGSLNQLYLVQFIDLETGEDLDRPVVTPFTVEHDLKSPVVAQGADETNSYTLSWKPVEGASKYAVYEYSGGCAYTLCCTTDSTSVAVEEFEKQKNTDTLLDLFKNDLAVEGYDVDSEGVAVMNSAVCYSDDLNNGYFTVVAVGADGKTSGISNMVDVREIAHNLPCRTAEGVLETEISEITDVPAYVSVEMADGTQSQMIIDYHGAQAFKYPDDPNKISVKAHVANTKLDSFLIVMNGMLYEDVVDQIKTVLDREDELLSNVRSADTEKSSMEITDEVPEEINLPEPDDVPVTEAAPEETEAIIQETDTAPEETDADPVITEEVTAAETESEPSAETEAPVSETEKKADVTDVPETEKTVEKPVTEPSVDKNVSVPHGNGNTLGEQALNEIEPKVSEVIRELGEDKIKTVLYAQTDLEAWIAYCLIAQNEVIPVPSAVFPEAANLEYLFDVFLEAYRQNPTSGIIDINNIRFNDEYESLIIPYSEDTSVRLEKTKQELKKAEEVAASETDPSMSDYEKVLALNEYFRLNASYDKDSMSTSVDLSNISESFIDAHTPYGILCSNYGVCESYSEAFILSSRMAGLESVAEFGTLFGGAHEWNRVKIDGNWCVLDITNNDNDYYPNALFSLSDRQIEGILVPSSQAVVDQSLFTATVDTNDYYYVNGKSASDLSQAKQMIEDGLKSASSVTVRLPLGTTEDEACEFLRKTAAGGAVFSKGGFHLGLVTAEK